MNKEQTTYNSRDVYIAFAVKLLMDNPDWWGKYDRSRRLKNGYIYCKKAGQVVEIINFARWSKIISTYFIHARRKVIDGKEFNFGNFLGKLRARRVTRNFANRQVNWELTSRQPKVPDPQTGKMKYAKVFYHTDDEWARISWERFGRLANESVYKFRPCGKTTTGFRGEFVSNLKANPAAIYEYKYFNHGVQIGEHEAGSG